MTDVTVRLLIVVGVLLAAGIIALVVNRFSRPPHPTLTVQPDGDRPGIVLFTSLDCPACKETITLVRGGGITFREITHEIEPQRFEAWQVLAVPLTVVLDSDGAVVDAITGVPSHRRLVKSARAAGMEVNG